MKQLLALTLSLTTLRCSYLPPKPQPMVCDSTVSVMMDAAGKHPVLHYCREVPMAKVTPPPRVYVRCAIDSCRGNESWSEYTYADWHKDEVQRQCPYCRRPSLMIRNYEE